MKVKKKLEVWHLMQTYIEDVSDFFQFVIKLALQPLWSHKLHYCDLIKKKKLHNVLILKIFFQKSGTLI